MTEKTRILLTGATGFIGQALLATFLKKNMETIVSLRFPSEVVPKEITQYVLGKITAKTDWSLVLEAVGIVIHAAARVHVMKDRAADPLESFRNTNTVATLNLARQAVDSGVKRFIFISSIKVNGETSLPGRPFLPDDFFIPDDPYALSKYEAEQGLLKIARDTAMEVVIIRPPLIYGPNVKANFASMIKWVNIGIPLPFGAIDNKRSLVALENLVDFIIHCLDHPKAANEIFLISDDEDVSTTELLRKVAIALGKRSRLVPVPVSWLRSIAILLGKRNTAERLFGSLQVDSSKAWNLLDWQPVINMDAQLKKTVEAYLDEKII